MAIDQSKSIGADGRQHSLSRTHGKSRTGGEDKAPANSGFSSLLDSVGADMQERSAESAVTAEAEPTKKKTAAASGADRQEGAEQRVTSSRQDVGKGKAHAQAASDDAQQEATSAPGKRAKTDSDTESTGVVPAPLAATPISLPVGLTETFGATGQDGIAAGRPAMPMAITGLTNTQRLQQSMQRDMQRVGTGTNTVTDPIALKATSTQQGTSATVSKGELNLRDLPGKFGLAATPDVATPPGVMELMASIITPSQGKAERSDLSRVSGSESNWSSETGAPSALELFDAGGALPMADEAAPAESVRFWMGSEQTQQAEMTVDDVGGAQVDVSIRLQGKEAQVLFRSEDASARDALQSGGGQLKELLGREGLTLSEMSVGTSAGGGADGWAGGRDGRPMPNAARKTGFATIEVDPSSVPSPNLRPGATRGIDFYV